MAKKSNKSLLPRTSDNPLPVDDKDDWEPTDLLDVKDNNAGSMDIKRLGEAKLLFPGSIEAVLPSETQRADWYRQNWVCFYFYPFDIGMTFPFSTLVIDVLSFLHVSPGQLMPFAWRTLACLDAIEKKHHLKISAEVVKCCYSIKKFSNCRFGFVNKNKDEPLILNNDTVNDRGWKSDYFFVNKGTLNKFSDYLLDRWNTEGITQLLLL